jgi:hypothetical protein
LLNGFAEAELDLNVAAFEDGDVTDDTIDSLHGTIGPCGWRFLEGGGEYAWGIGDDQLVPG